MFSEWKSKVIVACDEDIDRIMNDPNFVHQPYFELSKDAFFHLKKLQQSLVFVPVDKAANNIAIVCKRYYLTILQNELNNTGGAYTTTNITKKEHVDSLCKWFVGLNMNGTGGKSNNDFLKDVRLSSMYWLPKLHKTPVGTRFIACSPSII